MNGSRRRRGVGSESWRQRNNEDAAERGRNANAGDVGAEGWRGGGGVAFREERDQEEYLFVNQREEALERAEECAPAQLRHQHRQHQYHHRQQQHQRPESQASESASIHFLTDDREEHEGESATQLLARDVAEIHLSNRRSRQQPPVRRPPTASMGEVDYSPNDFRQAKAAIEDAAARQQSEGPPERIAGGGRGSRRVRQFGDTTVITEHRDPYSFYWQLDKLKKVEQEPPRSVPPVDYVLEEEEEEEEIEEEAVEEMEEIPQDYLSPDSGVHLEREQPEEGHYARPMKEWGRVEDPSVFSHYWHVDSAPRRKEPPPPITKLPSPPAEKITPSPPAQPMPARPISVTNSAQQTVAIPDEPLIEEHAFRQTTVRRRVIAEDEREDDSQRVVKEQGMSSPVRFVVRPLGYVEVNDNDLVDAERSQAVLNRILAQLGATATGTEGEVILELSGEQLRLIESDRNREERILRSEPLNRIRVWGVGGDETGIQREFAYVAQEPNGRFLCHVFRCNGPAKDIASALQHACDSLMPKHRHRRPDSLGSHIGRRRRTRESLPLTPIEEPKRIIRCHFIGVTQVPRATGIDTLNEAVDRLVSEVGQERWTLVDVHISPSVLHIFEAEGARRQVASCRIRYLSFLGIGRDVKHCAFIVAQSADHFICYVFHASPSASSLAKTIEAACKLRYQKVLDAHIGRNEQK